MLLAALGSWACGAGSSEAYAREAPAAPPAADTLATPSAPATPAFAAFPPPRVRAWQVSLARGDRLQHASLSFALATTFTLLARDRGVGAGVALALGVGKEAWDERGDRFDPVDLTADALGVALAALLVKPRGD